MASKLWDKRFVHFIWDDALEGKEVFASDRITTLRYDVEKDYLRDTVTFSGDEDFPFLSTGEKLKFCYYDPLYEYKRAYYVEGKKLLFKENPDSEAVPIQGEPTWQGEPEQYSILIQEVWATYRELAEWLAEGRGQYKREGKEPYHSTLSYGSCSDAEPLDSDIRVRRWGEEEWRIPTKEVLKCGR